MDTIIRIVQEKEKKGKKKEKDQHAPSCHILTDFTIIARLSLSPQLGSQVLFAIQKSRIGVSLPSSHGLPPTPSLHVRNDVVSQLARGLD